MATKRKSRNGRKVSQAAIGKPRGIIQHRVQKVGPEHFGIVAVDCAKARSRWMFCDFYGNVLLPPRDVEHQKSQLQLATVELKEACQKFQIHDHVVAVEMTGTWHRMPQRAFRKAGSDTRLVHPFASRYYRMPESPDIKTDDKDLIGIFRATVNGFGLLEPVWEEPWPQLQLLVRHRRDLVHKRSKLQCQIRQYLGRCLPGYADLFPNDDLWTRPVAMRVARHAITAQAILDAGIPGVTRWMQQEKVRFQSRTIDKIVAWAGNAADADPLALHLTRVWHALHDDWKAKTEQITALERD